MAILGPRALMDIALPSGVDASYIMRIQMEDGINAAEVITLAANVIGTANEKVLQMWGGIFFETQSLWARYRASVGSRSMTPLAAEFSQPDGVRGDDAGHMLPREDFKDGTGWSAEWLGRANRELVNIDLDEISERWYNRCDYQIIRRMLSKAENTVGQTGYSPGWAIGTGTNTDFVPPQYMSRSFDSTHTHYKKTDAAISASNFGAMLDTMALELSEHGHTGPKICFFSEANLSIVNGMANDKKYAKFYPASFVLNGSNTNGPVNVFPTQPLQGVQGEIVAYYASDYGMIELRYHPRIPAGYLWMGKSYGVNNRKNPIAIRTEKNKGFGLMVDPQMSRSMVPQLEYVLFKATHGVGVNDRLVGVAAQIANTGASYDEPTIAE